jgi:hypothetical protein
MNVKGKRTGANRNKLTLRLSIGLPIINPL